jgi:hypothetical protein
MKEKRLIGLTKENVVAAIMKWPGLYRTEDGIEFKGMPVSRVPSQLRECGWRNVSGLDKHELKKIGLDVVRARYVGGASPKRFCDVVVAGGK